MRLTRLHRTNSNSLDLAWDDGHEGAVSLKTLRDRCPCASCSGETVLLKTAYALPQDYGAPGRYELRSADLVGNYAVQLTWGDGHSQGIYTWEHLRELCECQQCSSTRLSDAGEREQ